jgi:hypothetical protein
MREARGAKDGVCVAAVNGRMEKGDALRANTPALEGGTTFGRLAYAAAS